MPMSPRTLLFQIICSFFGGRNQIWCLSKQGSPHPFITQDKILPGSSSRTSLARSQLFQLSWLFYLFSYYIPHHIQTATGNGQLPMPMPLAHAHQSSNYCQQWKRMSNLTLKKIEYANLSFIVLLNALDGDFILVQRIIVVHAPATDWWIPSCTLINSF